jgi:hypothetical protein
MLMKRIILLTCCAMLFTAGFAQVGVKMGVGVANVPYKDFDHKARSSFNIGFYFQQPLSKKIAVQPELIYTLKGYTAPIFQFADTSQVKMSVLYQYLNLPVMILFDVSNKFRLEAGPELGYLMRASGYSSNAFSSEKFDLGLAAGAMFKLSDRLSLDLRYTHGMLKIFKVEVKDINGIITEERKLAKNQTLHLSLFMALH